MKQKETITLQKEEKKAIVNELKYLTYCVPCDDLVIKRIMELVSIIAENEVIPDEFKYENFIERFYRKNALLISLIKKSKERF